jgi:hypothetical protein
MIIIVAMVLLSMPPRRVDPSAHLAPLAGAFRAAGWRVERLSAAARDAGVHLSVRKGPDAYAVRLKVASEGRADRLVPLLAQAILEARDAAHRKRDRRIGRPLPIVAAPRVSDSVVEHLRQFADRHADGGIWGVADLRGRRAFHGPGLEALNRRPAPRAGLEPVQQSPSFHLFSDLNQWMLKVLLAPLLPERLSAAPRGEYRNASELAAAAQVSVMSAYRLVRQLQEEQFMDRNAEMLRLVRIDALLERWRAASLGRIREVPARWILRGAAEARVKEALSGAEEGSCLGLFAAARALQAGHVHGVAPHIYVPRISSSILRAMGVSLQLGGAPPDLFLRRPSCPQSVFRAAVSRDGVRVSDVLQVWLDVSAHPSRGKEQADFIWRRLLGPALASAF